MGRPRGWFRVAVRHGLLSKKSEQAKRSAVVPIEQTGELVQRMCLPRHFSREHFAQWRRFLQTYMDGLDRLLDQLESGSRIHAVDACQSLIVMVQEQQTVKIGHREGQKLTGMFCDSQLARWRLFLQEETSNDGTWIDWVKDVQTLLAKWMPRLEDYTCAICSRCLYKPTTLEACRHSFCSACLQDAIRHATNQPRTEGESAVSFNTATVNRASFLVAEPAHVALTACPTCTVSSAPIVAGHHNETLDRFVALYFSHEYHARVQESTDHNSVRSWRWWGAPKDRQCLVSNIKPWLRLRSLLRMQSPLWSVYQDKIKRSQKHRCSQVTLTSARQRQCDDLTMAQGFIYLL